MSDWDSALISWLKLSNQIDQVVSSFRDFSTLEPFQKCFQFFFPDSDNSWQRIASMISWLNSHMENDFRLSPLLKQVSITELQNCKYDDLANLALMMFYASYSDKEKFDTYISSLNQYDSKELLQLIKKAKNEIDNMEDLPSNSEELQKLAEKIRAYSFAYEEAKNYHQRITLAQTEADNLASSSSEQLQLIEDNKKANIEKQKNEIAKFQEDNSHMQQEIEELNQQLKSQDANIDIQTILDLEAQVSGLANDIEILNKQIEQIKLKEESIEQFKRKKEQNDLHIKDMKEKISEIQNQIAPLLQKKNTEMELSQKLTKFKEDITKYENMLNQKKTILTTEKESGTSASLALKLEQLNQLKKSLAEQLQQSIVNVDEHRQKQQVHRNELSK